MWPVLITIIIAMFAVAIGIYVRREIQRSREALKGVDRSKLKDLDEDGWDDDTNSGS